MNLPSGLHLDEHGAATIEFIVSSIVLFTLVFGCIAVAMAFYTYEVLNEYTRDASRYAIVHGNGCIIQAGTNAGNSCSIGTGGGPGAPASMALKSYLNNEILPGINGNQLAVNTTYGPAPGATTCFATNCNGAGDQITVTVSYPYLYSVPFIPSQSFTMNATSTMVISQ
jgi:Flp pilus assembly protein TadG